MAAKRKAVASDPKRVDLGRIITATHPVFAAYEQVWKMYLACYQGGEGITRYIKQHVREDEEDVARRKKRSYYYNFTSMVVDMMSAFIYRADIVRQPAWGKVGAKGKTTKGKAARKSGIDTIVEEIYTDCDRAGNSLNQFMWSSERWARVFGYQGVLVDMPREVPKSEQERRELGHRPYLVPLSPLSIRAWAVDEKGELSWIRFIEDAGDQWEALEKRPKEVVTYYRTWTKDMWYLHKTVRGGRQTLERAEEVDRGKNPLGEVPVVFILHQKGLSEDDPIGLSFVRDIARINVAIFNWCSLIDEEIYNRCLNVLCMPAQPGQKKEVKLSHSNVLEYDPQATNPPNYLVSSGEPVLVVQGQIDQAVDQIYRLAGFGGMTGYERAKTVPSGIAFAYEFNETNQALSSDADDLQDVEVKIHRLIGKWLGKEYTGTVDYPEDFGVRNLLEELRFLAEFKEVTRSDTAKREMEKKVVEAVLSKATEEIRETIRTEIDTTDDLPPTSMGFEAGFGG